MAAAVGTVYTLAGGMWSVTATDAAQIAIVLIGLAILAPTTLLQLGGGSIGAGMTRLATELDPDMLTLVPRESIASVVRWLGLFCVAALGNLPGQDLGQRIFAAKSAQTAQRACWIAGVLYLLFGTVPVLLGLGGAGGTLWRCRAGHHPRNGSDTA